MQKLKLTDFSLQNQHLLHKSPWLLLLPIVLCLSELLNILWRTKSLLIMNVKIDQNFDREKNIFTSLEFSSILLTFFPINSRPEAKNAQF